jgi:hypothetical protein
MLALLAFACACTASAAHADGRFGDSTWVAPGMPLDSASTTDGPRVAPRDHERGWETALRAPFRVVGFPLRLVGDGLVGVGSYLGPRYFEPKPTLPPKAGPVLAPYIILGAANDIGVGPAVTWIGFPVAGATLHVAGSWSAIDRRTAHLSEAIGERRPVGFRVDADYDHRPNRRFYGIGNNTPQADLSYFRLANTHAQAAVLLGASPLRQLRIVGGWSRMSPGSGYHAKPLLEDVFGPAAGSDLHQTTQGLWYGAAADLGVLDEETDPSRGAQARIDLRRVVGLRSSDPDYSQWRVEGRAYVPVFAKRRVIALRGVYAGVEPGGDAATTLPFYLLPSGDGGSRFAGYASDRFRDRQRILARIEYRWGIIHQLSALGLYELGEVAPRAASFTLRGAHESYGGGLRLGLGRATALRFELAKSVEGLHAVLGLGSEF